MGLKKSAAGSLDDAESNVLDEDESHINGNPVLRGVEESTESSYAQMLAE
jgi:hypothetical protein